MEKEAEPSVSQPNPHPGYKNAREYAQALREWMFHYQTCCAMQNMAAQSALHHVQAMSNVRPHVDSNVFDFSQHSQRRDPYAQRRHIFVNREFIPPAAAPPAPGQQEHHQQQPAFGAGPGAGGVLYKVPTFWKRIAAELIDFTLLFYIKMLVSISLMSELNLDQIDSVVFFRSIFGTEEIYDSFNELDYEKAFAITFEVIALEIINRVIITIFETMCLYRARVRGQPVGATPGKRFMGLKVVSCTFTRDVGFGQILVLPAGAINLRNAFLRSVIKNFTIAFFFPACLTLFFFKHNRTAYDVIAHTIVVETI